MMSTTVRPARGRFLFPVLLIAIMGAVFAAQASLIDVPAMRALASFGR